MCFFAISLLDGSWGFSGAVADEIPVERTDAIFDGVKDAARETNKGADSNGSERTDEFSEDAKEFKIR